MYAFATKFLGMKHFSLSMQMHAQIHKQTNRLEHKFMALKPNTILQNDRQHAHSVCVNAHTLFDMNWKAHWND